MNVLAIFGFPGGMEWFVIGGLALLLFGRRLPDVARSFGKSIVEFKKGLHDVKDDIDTSRRIEPPRERRLDSEADTRRPAQAHAGDESGSSRPAPEAPAAAGEPPAGEE